MLRSERWKFGRELYAEREAVVVDLNTYSIAGIFEDAVRK
jgi:hypothetical protein